MVKTKDLKAMVELDDIDKKVAAKASKEKKVTPEARQEKERLRQKATKKTASEDKGQKPKGTTTERPRFSASRSKLPIDVQTPVLTKSGRRCAWCFGLRGDDAEKQGQIAHIDQNRGNNVEDNLVFLCLDHHDKYDSKTSQSKGLTEGELRVYRVRLYAAVAASLSHTELPTIPKPQIETDRKRWEPIRHSVVVELAHAYSSALVGAHKIATLQTVLAPVFQPASETASLFVQGLTRRLEILRESVTLNAEALKPDILPDVLRFIKEANEVLRRVRFFADFHRFGDGYQYIGVSPVEPCTRMEATICGIKNQWADVFSDGTIVVEAARPASEIAAAWEAFQSRSDLVFCEPSKWVHKAGTTPVVMDAAILRKIPPVEGLTYQMYYAD